jgi:hypothetical protein
MHQEYNCVYNTCLTQKSKKRSYNHQITPGEYNIKLIHSNIIGLVPVKNYNSCRYFVIFECDKTKLAAVYYMKSKGEITDYFIYFKKHFEHLDLG